MQTIVFSFCALLIGRSSRDNYAGNALHCWLVNFKILRLNCASSAHNTEWVTLQDPRILWRPWPALLLAEAKSTSDLGRSHTKSLGAAKRWGNVAVRQADQQHFPNSALLMLAINLSKECNTSIYFHRKNIKMCWSMCLTWQKNDQKWPTRSILRNSRLFRRYPPISPTVH